MITIASPLQLQLDGLSGGAEQTIVLQRAVLLGAVTEATLRVGVAAVALESPATRGFVLEARPVLLGQSPDQDVLGDPIASISITEVTGGTLLLASMAEGAAGAVQVSIRCGQPLAGPLQLRAHVDLVVKWTEAPRRRARRGVGRSLQPWIRTAPAGADRLGTRADASDDGSGRAAVQTELEARVATRTEAVLQRIAELARRLGPRRWLERAKIRAWQARDAATTAIPCGCDHTADRGSPALADASFLLPTDLSRNLAPPRLVAGPARDDPPQCSEGVCCTTTTLVVGPDAFGNTDELLAQVCYPSAIATDQPVGLFLLTHGSPDGSVPDDPHEWLDTGGADFLPLQHDLARAGIISFFVVRIGGYSERAEALMQAIGAAKLYITSQAALDPTSPLAAVDVQSLQVALGGHSDGGAAATIAASLDRGVPVRAVVGLASGQGDLENAALHPGTYYLGVVGTHDGSPLVRNKGPVGLYDQVETDRPKLLVVLRGVSHGQLGPGIGSAALKPDDYMQVTAAAGEVALAARSYLVRAFLRWSLLHDLDAGRILAIDDVDTVAWGETLSGDSAPAVIGVHTTTRLATFPAGTDWLGPFECRTIYSPSAVGTVEAVSGSIYGTSVATLENATTPADQDIRNCNDVIEPSWAPSTGHKGVALFVGWDAALGDASGAVLRFDLGDALGIVGGFQPPDQFSILVEIALRTNAPANVPVVEATGAVEWWPALGLGDASGPTRWVCPQPVLYGFGYPCPLVFMPGIETPLEDARRTVFTSISARLPLLRDEKELWSATHVYVDLMWGSFQRGEAVIRNLSLVYHG
ncbi:MAG: hypothetical protein U0168_23965 [Nannocystaceae bacterium]